MQAIEDIFQIWPTTADLAREVNQNYDTVRKWKEHGRIPATAWRAVIIAAAKRERIISVDDLMRTVVPRRAKKIQAGAAA